MRKYGYDQFTVKELIRANDWTYLCDLERKVIVAFGTTTPRGYNTAEGGEGATTPLDKAYREEHCRKTSEAVKLAWSQPEYRAAHMVAFSGEQFRSAISKSMQAKWKDPELRPTLERNFKKANEKLREIQRAATRHISCGICSKSFDVKPSNKRAKYCSIACSAMARRKGQIK
jgi:hypothetical protein